MQSVTGSAAAGHAWLTKEAPATTTRALVVDGVRADSPQQSMYMREKIWARWLQSAQEDVEEANKLLQALRASIAENGNDL